MKKLIIALTLLHLVLITSAQTFQSNKISFLDLYERIDFYDDEDSTIVSLAPRFYRHRALKKHMKPIQVKDQAYFIKIEKFGVQSVYTNTGEHVANMDREGSTIHLLQDNSTYSLRPRLRLANYNVLECRNSEGVVISKVSHTGDKKLTYDYNGEQHPNLLLMALCAHQYQELLLGDRGRLTSMF